ncbi:hypothetical protein ADIARSV_1912 [Arcticibacter svalbardensis MN12-7]|uniref:Uncharacterized protein n=1 Tax=Arcticibacter svalbardensis MN12-7 TaxID=1150600 RepID=R9GTA9_9SPHI|nr:hypothetical protein ADIARSV_1912 [Arcticibacter svalbardensis MN12-7]
MEGGFCSESNTCAFNLPVKIVKLNMNKKLNSSFICLLKKINSITC